MDDTRSERTYEAKSLSAVRRQANAHAVKMALEGYKPTGETLTVKNPEAPASERIFRLIVTYRR